MTTINLKDFYSWYTHDEYIEVPDEVAEELKADKRYEAAYRRRVTRNKAQYSLDCDDGIEYSACLHEPSPEELVLRAERFFYLWNALNTLPDTLAEVNLSAQNVTVWTKADADEEVIRKAIRDAGYLPLRTREKV